ncbi:hypothetical protein FUA23_20090 [Neolewinella aurantiaca]|uniref:Type I restriction modification DNA specificity domain-containing protein n=1 Tax=Neolewinella aurantiaca TaxID=2602767 RepID=A0A5C7F7H7_9BACT|nr:restriction endonuclease subunit S [Neolewinella aurantiaca]TXF85963.1 hypothetical protein FUA23_20090 [Neolewinella aurantiaca]
MVRDGYKQTEVGVIPEDWEVVEIGSVTTRVGDGLHSTPMYDSSGSYSFINGNNLKDGRIFIYDNTKRVDDTQYDLHKIELNASSVLMSINGTIGNIALYEGEKILLGKSAAYLNFKSSVDRKYMAFCLASKIIQQSFNDNLTGTTIKNLGLKVISSTPIPLPTLREQRAIARALSDTDALLSALDALIGKKEAFKRGMMEGLLSGEIRLEGFEGEWGVSSLGKLCELIGDGTHQTPKYVESGVTFVSVENVTSMDFTNTKFISEDAFDAMANYSKTRRNDVLLTRIGTLGETALVDWDTPAAIYVSLALLRFADEITAKWVYTFSKSSIFIAALEARSLMNAIPKKINLGEISGIPIPIPPLSEQRAIARVLSDLDAELSALRARRAKLAKVKAGMMGELLTGAVRLV